MPLKHSTETFLIILLAACIILASIVAAILPSPSVAIWPWIVAFSISVLYPLALYPLFRERRADYEFRALHFAPAAILLLWLVFRLLSPLHPTLHTISENYTWGWTLFGDVISFILLMWYCLHVIRQRTERIGTLIPLLLLFIVFAVSGERLQAPEHLTAMMWNGSSSSLSSAIAVATASKPSSDEAAWQLQQQVMQRRDRRIASQQSSSVAVRAAAEGVMASLGNASAIIASGSSSSVPTHLVSSGPETEVFLLLAIAIYCAVLHERARRRAVV